MFSVPKFQTNAPDLILTLCLACIGFGSAAVAAGENAPAKRRPSDAEIQEALKELAEGAFPALRRHAARRLMPYLSAPHIHVKDHPKLILALTNRLKTEPHGSVRREILTALGQSGDATVWAILAKHLADKAEPDSAARAAAAAAIGSFGFQSAPAAPFLLRQLATDDSGLAAAAAARALGRMAGDNPNGGNKGELAAWEAGLHAGLRSRDGRVRRACVNALRAFKRIPDGDGAAAVRDEQVAALLTADNEAVAAAALRALHQPHDLAKHRAAVRARLDHSFPRIQAAAARAIGRWAAGLLAQKKQPAPTAGLLPRLRELAASRDVEVKIEATAALAWLRDSTDERLKALMSWRQETRLLGLDARGRLYTTGELARKRLNEFKDAGRLEPPTNVERIGSADKHR